MKTIKSGITGILLANTVFNLMAMAFVDETIRQYIIGAMLLGLAIGLAATVYRIEKLPILAKMIIHLSVSYIAFLTVAYQGHWFPFQMDIIVSGTILFMAIFFIIWLVFYTIEKKNVTQINKRLAEKKK